MPGGPLALYLDWCTVRARDPFPLTAGLLAAFAADTGRTPGIGLLRVLLAEQARRGLGTARQGAEPVEGEDRAADDTLLQAAARCPTVPGPGVRWTDAVRGRRDALLLVARWSGLTRRRIVGLTTRDLDDGGLLSGLGCRCDTALACPRRVVEQWATLLPALQSGSRGRAQQVLSGTNDDPEPAETAHDGPLLFSIDRHGWAEPDRALSTRAVTNICAIRLAHVKQTHAAPGESLAPRSAGLSDAGWDDLLDRLDATADELDARACELLGEAMSQAAWVRQAWQPPAR